MATKLDMKAFLKFREIISNDLRGSGFGPIRVGLKQWAQVYRSFVQERFDMFSRGGGNWAPLQPSTIARRKKGRRNSGAPRAAILRDKSIMFAALNPKFTGKPGALEKKIPFGVRVGFGGPGRHPDGSATVADIAGFHNEGVPGKFPARKIIVPPDQPTISRMVQIMEFALAKTIKAAT